MSRKQKLSVCFGIVLTFICASSVAEEKAPETAGSVSCSSETGQQEHCPADTTTGVVLLKSTGSTGCLLGKTWGYDDESIWAHVGLGRIVYPDRTMASSGTAERSPNFMLIIEAMLKDPTLSHLYFDISWDEVAKYATETPESVQRTADVLNRFPDRFLFGTDNVAPKNPEDYYAVYETYSPIWEKLTAETKEEVLKGNYERLFDDARKKVRAWEKANIAGGK